MVVAVAGFRVLDAGHGADAHVDDLVTDVEQRSRGYGKAMLEWLREYARRRGARRSVWTQEHIAMRRTRFISASVCV